MNTPAESDRPSLAQSQWERSTTRRFFCWRIQRRLLFFLVVTVTLVALLIVEENWRGHRAWNRYEAQLQASGEPTRIAELIPPPVPDHQNFVATPFWTDRRYRWSQPRELMPNTNRWPNDLSLATSKARWIRGNLKPIRPHSALGPIDLPAVECAWSRIGNGDYTPDPGVPPALDGEARARSAEAILGYLQIYEPVLEEFRQASHRTDARFPVDYDTPNPAGILLPHLAPLKSACHALQLKVAAELATGNTERAMADIALMLRLADAVKSEPILISQMVRLACLQLAIDAIWEGLMFHSWTAPQLEQLQSLLQTYELVGDSARAIDSERVSGTRFVDYLQRNRDEALEEMFDPPNWLAPLFALAPRGWFSLEKLTYNRLFDAYIRIEAPSMKAIDPRLIDGKAAALEAILTEPAPLGGLLKHHLMARLLSPSGKWIVRGARTQSFVSMAMLGCGLERYRLAHGDYPPTLQALSPQFIGLLPDEVVVNQPYRYRRVSNTAFVLYSVGWDQTDDGGKETDWVWMGPHLEPLTTP